MVPRAEGRRELMKKLHSDHIRVAVARASFGETGGLAESTMYGGRSIADKREHCVPADRERAHVRPRCVHGHVRRRLLEDINRRSNEKAKRAVNVVSPTNIRPKIELG